MAQKKSPWLVRVLAIAALIALCLFCRQCGINSVLKNTHSDTLIKHDTEFVSTPYPVPYKVRYDSIIKVPYKVTEYDTLWGVNEVSKTSEDTVRMVKDYNTVKFYDTTIKLKRGSAHFQDTLFRNRIVGRSYTLFNTDTVINKTTVLTLPRHFVGYVSFSGFGNRSNPVYGIGLGLGVKMPDDNSLDLSFLKVKDQKGFMYMLTYRKPIRLRKK